MTTTSRLNVRRVYAPKVARARRKPAQIVTPSTGAGPIIKWAGGKTKLLPEITKRIPSSYKRYFEPFMGGAAVFFNVAPENAVLNDWNRDLVNMYRCVAWNVEGVIRRLRKHRQMHCEAYYYQMRELWNEDGRTWGNVDRAAAFIYLNKTCFNGLWRVNKKGKFNVPAGRYKSPQIFDPDNMRNAGKLLRRTELRTGDYRDAVAGAGAGDFVYFDPPYQPVNTTAKFTSYTEADFGEDNQLELAALARQLSDRGCYVMLSNSDTPFIRKIYKGFKIETVKCPRAINSKASSRGKVDEVLITNKR
jgi:DNA adenine methylase